MTTHSFGAAGNAERGTEVVCTGRGTAESIAMRFGALRGAVRRWYSSSGFGRIFMSILCPWPSIVNAGCGGRRFPSPMGCGIRRY